MKNALEQLAQAQKAVEDAEAARKAWVIEARLRGATYAQLGEALGRSMRAAKNFFLRSQETPEERRKRILTRKRSEHARRLRDQRTAADASKSV